jgi:DNA-binding transcriptional ArsR family regulator
MRDAELTTEAAKLAERILDEISRLNHDWEDIAVWAHELAELGEIGASVAGEPDTPGSRRNPSRPRGSRRHDFPAFGTEERARLATFLAALGHPTRLLILQALSQGQPLSPTHIAQLEPDTSLPVIAYHARELRDRGLIASAGIRQARGAVQHFYTLSPRGRALLESVEQLSTASAAP